MDTKRFGKTVPLPSTAAIKDQVRKVDDERDVPSADGSVPTRITDPAYIGADRHREI